VSLAEPAKCKIYCRKLQNTHRADGKWAAVEWLAVGGGGVENVLSLLSVLKQITASTNKIHTGRRQRGIQAQGT